MTKPFVSIAAVGDIAFTGRLSDNVNPAVFAAVYDHFAASDLVIGNLESPLTGPDNPIPGKCTLRGSTGWATVMKDAGIDVVTLANNHLMDYGEGGLFSTIDALDQAGLKYVGAGKNRADANKPLVVTISGKRIGLLARSAVIVSSRAYADDKNAGVAWFDTDETISTIKKCKAENDFVILLVHWGLENYSNPSPKQRSMAETLVRAGADAVIGHHPHVLQGSETIEKSIVVYSLGNFLFEDFDWSFVDRDKQAQNRTITLSTEGRQGGILDLSLSDNGTLATAFIPIIIQPGGIVAFDGDTTRIQSYDRLGSILKRPWYNAFWHLYAARKEWGLRVRPLYQGKLNLSSIKKIRPRHFVELVKTFRRSTKVMSQKSTNPYE